MFLKKTELSSLEYFLGFSRIVPVPSRAVPCRGVLRRAGGVPCDVGGREIPYVVGEGNSSVPTIRDVVRLVLHPGSTVCI